MQVGLGGLMAGTLQLSVIDLLGRALLSPRKPTGNIIPRMLAIPQSHEAPLLLRGKRAAANSSGAHIVNIASWACLLHMLTSRDW